MAVNVQYGVPELCCFKTIVKGMGRIHTRPKAVLNNVGGAEEHGEKIPRFVFHEIKGEF